MIKTKFWVFCVLMIVIVGANFFYTAQRLDADAVSTSAELLAWSEERVDAVETVEARAVLDAARLASANARVRSGVRSASAAGNPPGDSQMQDVLEALAEIALEEGADHYRMVILSTGEGARQFHVERPTEEIVPPPDIPALLDALDGRETVGFLAGDGELLRVAAVPIATENTVYGAVLVGYVVDEAYAERVAEAVGLNVSVMAEGAMRVSTAPSEWRANLSTEARAAAVGETFGFGGPFGTIAPITSAVTGVEPVLGYGRKVSLGEADDAFIVLSVSTYESYSWLDLYQTLQAGVLGLIVLLGLVWGFVVSGAANKPVRRMASQISRAASGDVKTRVETAGFKGEMRRLAEMVNGVLDQAERKAPISAGPIGGKQSDIASLLPESQPDSEEAAPDAFDFGFEGAARSGPDASPTDSGAPVPESLQDQEEGPRDGQPADSAESAEDEAVGSDAAGDQEPTTDSGAEEQAEDDPFAVFGAKAASESPLPPPETEGSAAVDQADAFSQFGDAGLGGSPMGGEGESLGATDESGGHGSVLSAEMGLGSDASALDPAFSPPPPAPEEDPIASAMSDSSAMSDLGDDEDDSPAATVVAKVPDALLQATARTAGAGGKAAGGPQDPDEAHFREVFRSFVATRQKCGEPADGITFEKFAVKLRKNRDTIMEKYGAKTVRFQVHVKAGKAALKATPVR